MLLKFKRNGLTTNKLHSRDKIEAIVREVKCTERGMGDLSVKREDINEHSFPVHGHILRYTKTKRQ